MHTNQQQNTTKITCQITATTQPSENSEWNKSRTTWKQRFELSNLIYLIVTSVQTVSGRRSRELVGVDSSSSSSGSYWIAFWLYRFSAVYFISLACKSISNIYTQYSSMCPMWFLRNYHRTEEENKAKMRKMGMNGVDQQSELKTAPD